MNVLTIALKNRPELKIAALKASAGGKDGPGGAKRVSADIKSGR